MIAVGLERRALASHSLDRDLIARAGAGDGEAFAALVSQLQPLVHRWALMFAEDPDDADDVVQEAFVSMHLRMVQYHGVGPLEGWLYGIVRRVAGQRRRKARRRARLGAGPKGRSEMEVYLTDPGARVDRELVAARIRELFEELPARQREIFDLVDLQGYDPIEVALMIGLKPSTVRTNLFKARSSLRAHLIASHPAAAEIT
jgi:RNA polymerase sigma factor (sigma-70 family)